MQSRLDRKCSLTLAEVLRAGVYAQTQYLRKNLKIHKKMNQGKNSIPVVKNTKQNIRFD